MKPEGSSQIGARREAEAMPRKCSVCASPDRDKIDQALIAGESPTET